MAVTVRNSRHRRMSAVWAAGICTILVLTSSGSAQELPERPAVQPTFDVASVKRNETRVTDFSWEFSPSGDLTMTNLTLRRIVSYALGIDWNLERFRLRGSQQLLSARFDIRAKASADATKTPMMLKALLESRFKLRAHHETRDLPVYFLRVASGGAPGPELRRSAHDCQAVIAAGGRPEAPRDARNRTLCWRNSEYGPGPLITSRYAGVMTQLARRLEPLLDRPVIDRTELTGTFEWQLTYPLSGDASQTSAVFTAVREQLGLRLEAGTGPVDVVVIDSLEPPSPD